MPGFEGMPQNLPQSGVPKSGGKKPTGRGKPGNKSIDFEGKKQYRADSKAPKSKQGPTKIGPIREISSTKKV